ncbi:MAG: hypothetical protein AAGK21_14965 [Bacteroidota bacterium]
MRVALALGLWVILLAPASAQHEVMGPVHLAPMPAVEHSAPLWQQQLRQRSTPTCDPATDGAQFDVEYVGFPAEAQTSFQRAVDVWSCLIRTEQTIRVLATWTTLDATTLGSAGPLLFRNFDGAPARDVWYPSALADAFAGRDLGEGADINALFNSDFPSWHFDEEPPGDGQFDLTTVVLHELAHGLGFIGSLEVRSGVGVLGSEGGFPFSYDLNVQDVDGTAVLDADVYPQESFALAQALQSELRFFGRAVAQAVTNPVPLFAPPRWTPGGSLSHLDEDAYPTGTPDGLMTPFIARQEVVSEPGIAVCAILADIGWTLAGACAERVGDLPDVEPSLDVRQLGPNPFQEGTTLLVTSTAPLAVRASLVDVLGRRVADYGTTVLIAGRQLRIRVEGRPLAPGVYLFVLDGATDRLAIPVTKVR